MEREQERDEHQTKIDHLESLLRDKDRQDSTVRRQTDEVLYNICCTFRSLIERVLVLFVDMNINFEYKLLSVCSVILVINIVYQATLLSRITFIY